MGLQASGEHTQPQGTWGRSDRPGSAPEPRPRETTRTHYTSQRGLDLLHLETKNLGQAAPELAGHPNPGYAVTVRSQYPELWLLSYSPEQLKRPLDE